jgi:hypothetical protein
MPAVNKQSCPVCHQSVNERQITLFTDLIKALWKVFLWCEKESRSEFRRKEVKHLFTNENQSARFGDLILFGKLIKRQGSKKGHYAIDFELADKFFSGRLQIPSVVWHNPLTNEYRSENLLYVHEIKKLNSFLDEDSEFVARYRGMQRDLF